MCAGKGPIRQQGILCPATVSKEFLGSGLVPNLYPNGAGFGLGLRQSGIILGAAGHLWRRAFRCDPPLGGQMRSP